MSQRLVKFETYGDWFSIDDLKSIIELLEQQESTDKNEKGCYHYDDGVLTFDYFIDDEGDITIDKIQTLDIYIDIYIDIDFFKKQV